MRRVATIAAVTTAAVLWVPATSYAVGSHSPPRPHSEHVPASLRTAHVTYRDEPFDPVSRRRTVHGAKARALVRSFDALNREPKHYLTCDVAGGPTETVIFRARHHVWRAQQSPCSQVQVTRDDQQLPTLLSSQKWSAAVAAALHLGGA